jgi:hypothetical protein
MSRAGVVWRIMRPRVRCYLLVGWVELIRAFTGYAKPIAGGVMAGLVPLSSGTVCA